MLVLGRQEDESVVIRMPDGRTINVCAVRCEAGRCRLGFDAPADVEILRYEVMERIARQNHAAAQVVAKPANDGYVPRTAAAKQAAAEVK